MTPFSNSPLLFLLLIASASAKTTISFYQNTSCAADSPSAGDAFNNDNLATGSGICYKSPANTVTLKIEEIDEGCSVTAYLDTTCSMPTSEALTSTHSPCSFLGPTDLVGSFKAKCSTSTASNTSSTYDHDGSSTTTSPGLQTTPGSGASLVSGSDRRGYGSGWLELGIRALMSMSAVDVAWGWGML